MLALLFLLMPFHWIQEIHAWLGLGEMSYSPITAYLTRSVCLFYGIFGANFIVVSFDIDRYARLITFWGVMIVVAGIVLMIVDWQERLPLSWILSEGVGAIIFGLFFLWLLRSIGRVKE